MTLQSPSSMQVSSVQASASWTKADFGEAIWVQSLGYGRKALKL